MELKVSNLADKAVLVKLTMRRANLRNHDKVAEEFVQQQLDDASLIVSSKLFRDKANPVHTTVSLVTAGYTLHKKLTSPWVDKGPRILANKMLMEYRDKMREAIDALEGNVSKLMPIYDTCVQQDIDYRSRSAQISGKPLRAQVSDYPTAEQFRERMSLSIKFLPMPDQKHFLYDLPDEDLAEFRSMMDAAAVGARNDAVARMLDPLKHLADKLSKPIGTEGAIFRDSAIENIIEGIDVARKLALDDSPDIERITSELEQQIKFYDVHTEWLRESPIERDKAAKKLQQIADAMGAFMCATN